MFKSEIVCCSKELTAVERIKFKDVTESYSLAEVETEPITIKPNYWGEIKISNDKIEDEIKEYPLYVIVDNDGKKYHTSSPSFWSSFNDLMTELKDVSTDEFSIKIYTAPSKNYKGKSFITCSVV